MNVVLYFQVVYYRRRFEQLVIVASLLNMFRDLPERQHKYFRISEFARNIYSNLKLNFELTENMRDTFFAMC